MSVSLLAWALSLDGLLVGLTYGARGMRVPLRALVILGACSGVAMGGSMVVGAWLLPRATQIAAHRLGGALLAALGFWQLFKAWVERRGRGPLIDLRLRGLGLVVQVLWDPTGADRDRSGSLDAQEALVLGVALGMDAAAAGVAASILAYGPVLLGAVCVGLPLLTAAGLWLGRHALAQSLRRRLPYLPGLLLVAAGVLQW